MARIASGVSRYVVAALLLLWIGAASAQDAYGFHEKGIERINKAKEVSPLSVDVLFGDRISNFNGAADFFSTDIAVPGNNALPVELRRSLKVDDRSRMNGLHLGGFGEWDLDIPHISSVIATAKGWRPAGGTVDQRCSVPGPLESMATVAADDYWDGYQLYVPAAGGQTLLMDPSPAIPSPGNGTVYPWITKNMWRISCKSATKNGYAGQAFMATSPDGVKYHFDWVVSKAHSSVKGEVGLALKEELDTAAVEEVSSATVSRQVVYFLVSRIEDRFGNWVDYTYTGDRLTQISSSDLRTISLVWNGTKISSASSNIGGWSYTYSGEKLSQVNLPDGSKWGYVSTGALAIVAPGWSPVFEDPTGCPDSLEEPSGLYGLTITAPSGAAAQYSFQVRLHQRSNIPESACYISSPQYWFMKVPRFHWSLTLVSKRITGPGMPVMDWAYTYGFPDSFFGGHVKENTVTGPDGEFARYHYGTGYNLNEGQLLKTERGSSASSILSTHETTYISSAEAGGQSFPSSVGLDPKEWSDLLASSWLRPERESVITQDGTDFRRLTNTFDVFARALSVTKASTLSGGPSRTEKVEYHDNLGKWVIGQVKSVTCVSPASCTPSFAPTGLVVSQTDYDAATASPLKTYRFGKLQQTLTYNADGTVASVKDGNNRITSLSSWYRGVPRTITYADNTTQSAVVNDSGWVTKVTSEKGFATSYTYDPMGRLASITHPTLDTTSWNPTTQVFEQVAAAEYGIPAGHWRQTVSTGNARKITYFDALWRPLITREYDVALEASTKRFQRFAYDHNGRTLFASYPGTSEALTTGVWTEYDALGRQTSVSQDTELGMPMTTTTQYLSGFKTRTTSPSLHQTTTSYMAYDQPGYDWPVAIAHPEGANTSIVRDVFGKPLTLRRHDAAGAVSVTRSYTYNANQELCQAVEPETQATLMGYDAAGNLKWSASGQSPVSTCPTSVATGQRVSRVYDARNRLFSLTFPDGKGNQAWTYDLDGAPLSVTTSNEGVDVVNTYTYNKRRLLTGETQNQADGYLWSVTYGYDNNAYLGGIIYPAGLTVDITNNGLGQPRSVGSYATGITYHPNGAIKQFTYGNGVIRTLSQNARQLPMRVTDQGPLTKPLDLAYTYDNNGNVSSIGDYTLGATQSRTMAYDGLDRLVMATGTPFGTANYTYDVLDNLKTVKTNARNHTYFYDASNRLTTVNNTVGGAAVIGLSYDVRGNLANKNGIGHQFDFGNRLRTVSGRETYRYDGQGLRVRSTDTSTIYSMYGQSGKLLFQRDERAGKRLQYVYLGDQLLAVRERPVGGDVETWKYQHNDVLGTPFASSDATGTVLETSTYEPYGRLTNRPTDNRPGFTGHVQDAATGLTYMQQRYYDPQIGRFLSVDPVAADGNMGALFNRYMYVANNPYRFFDPDGRCTGSRIENDDGTCKSTGGFTTQSTSARLDTVSGSRLSARNGSENSHRAAAPGSVFESRNQAEGEAAAYVTELNGGPIRSLFGGQRYLTNIVELDSANAFTYTLIPVQTGMPPAVVLRGGGSGSTIFRTAHSATRLEAAGLNVARTQAIIAREVARIRPNMAVGADVVGRMRVNGVLVEYRMRALPNGTVNVGTIFPVK